MPTSPLRHRLAAATTLSLLTAALLAVPATAAGKTRVVAADGKASATNCNATTKAFSKTIQPAINASGPGDIVKVCPGTYTGQLVITGARAGMRLVAATSTKPVIKTTARDFTDSQVILVEGVANVLIRGLAIRALTFGAGDFDQGIVVNSAANATIRGNDIRWSGPAGALSRLNSAIVFAGATGTIRGNTIKDPLESGIWVDGSFAGATIRGNTIRGVHAGQQPQVQNGVLVSAGATALVEANTVIGDDVPGSPLQTKVVDGVDLDNAASTADVLDNDIDNVNVGIRTKGSGYSVSSNRVLARQTGISMNDTDNSSILLNTARATGGGANSIWVSSNSDNNTINLNDFRGSGGTDCLDAGGTPLGNSWPENEGDDDSPNGICSGIIEDPA